MSGVDDRLRTACGNAARASEAGLCGSRSASDAVVRDADDYSSAPVDRGNAMSLLERARALAEARGARPLVVSASTRRVPTVSGSTRTLSSSLTARSHGVLATVRDRSRTITSPDLALSESRTSAFDE